MKTMEKFSAMLVAIILKILPTRVARAIFYRLPAMFWRFDTIVNHKGVRLNVWTGENIGRKLFFLDDFEGEQIDIFTNLVDSDTVFFDVGANIGIYSLMAGKKGAKVYAFEPSPEVLPYLEKNIELNKFDITLVKEAVGDKVGQIPFYVSTKENMGVGRIMEYGRRTEKEKPPVMVSMNALDYYVGQCLAPTLIKMDIEGAEWFAIQGGEQTFSRDDAPVLMIEFHPGEIKHLGGDSEELMKKLRSYGYHQYQHKHAIKERWYVFSKQPMKLDGFSEIS
jgi:FkbM family methyltransferase